MVSQEESDTAWSDLASAEASSRESQMATRYMELATLAIEDRKAKLKAMARAEFALPDESLKPFTVSRMRTWISLPDEVATVIARDYDAIMQEMPAAIAMRRVFLVQTLVRDFTPEEEEKLRGLVPAVFAGAPSRQAATEAMSSGLAIDRGESKKPWWAFWRKG